GGGARAAPIYNAQSTGVRGIPGAGEDSTRELAGWCPGAAGWVGQDAARAGVSGAGGRRAGRWARRRESDPAVDGSHGIACGFHLGKRARCGCGWRRRRLLRDSAREASRRPPLPAGRKLHCPQAPQPPSGAAQGERQGTWPRPCPFPPGMGSARASAVRRTGGVILGVVAVALAAGAVVLFTLYMTCGLRGCPDVRLLRGYEPDEASVVLDRNGAELMKLYRVR